MMRLLKRSPSGDIQLVSVKDDDNLPPYAILSHTWTDGQEVTYNEMTTGNGKSKTGYSKIRFCVDRATEDKIEHCWVDTCCIDKSSQQELQTSINSMFRYYQRASKCYTYLSDVEVPKEISDAQAFPITWAQAFRQSRWFTRGWTLQELLAPASVEFFSKDAKLLGSRISLEQDIHEITKLPIEVLRGQRLSDFSVDERLGWAANRTTTLREDKVYCLLGIFEVFLPLIYGEGEAYAESRLRAEINRRKEGRGTERLQDLAVSSPLPFPRDEHFTGREDELKVLEQFLRHSTHRRMTIYGLGGCGKSSLAIEFAYRALAERAGRLVFWVPALSQESFELAYRDIGVGLSMPGILDDNADVKQLVKDALNLDSTREWLMIVDNADDPEVLISGASKARLVDYLPNSNRGKILFTTRSRKAAGDLTQSSKLELKDMGEAEAKQLLVRSIPKHVLQSDTKAVDELLELLAYLPLAIVQAAAFIDNNDMTVSRYISLIRKTGTKAELFGEHFEDPNRYHEMDNTIAKTWHISFDQIQKQDPLAADYLSFVACIDHINIPQSLLPPGGSEVQQSKALGTLKGYAFITERQQVTPGSASEIFFDLHRLVHMALGWWLDSQDAYKSRATEAAGRLEQLVPYGRHENRDIWTRYLPHAMHVAGLDGTVDEDMRVSLLDRVGRCQSSLGQYSMAEITHRRALSLREKRLGKEDKLVLTSMNDLGIALGDQGKYAEAEMMHRQTLAMRKRLLGAEHPSTLTTMNNLASVLGRQGKYAEAEKTHRQELAICKKVFSAEHPSTLTTMNNLALVLGRQGRYAEAETMHRRTLAIRERVLGAEHPSTLTTMNNLAYVLGRQGRYAEAETMHRRTLAIRERVLGAEHPSTLTTMNNLASVLGRQGKYEEAISLYERTYAGFSKVLGDEHPYTRICHKSYAYTLASQRQALSAGKSEVSNVSKA